MADDRRLIEDYLPIEEISEAASSEPRTKGHLSTLHIWRARRPLVACRAAVYGSLVLSTQFTNEGANPSKESRKKTAVFLTQLCKYPGDSSYIELAKKHILEAHAQRLSEETGDIVEVTDIKNGKYPRPKVLDLFAGGGAIPLEASRLGCETYAVDLNPVAHLIELCTITYPQKFGVKLADDIEFWGKKILETTKASTSDLYANIPIPNQTSQPEAQAGLFDGVGASEPQFLSIVAHYWTRTVPCTDINCGATVPLYRQTWLRKKSSKYVALKPQLDFNTKKIKFQVKEGYSEESLGFDPGEGSENTETDCPFCKTAIKGEYVRKYGNEKGFGQQIMCVITLNPFDSGKIYISDETLIEGEIERQSLANERAILLEQELGDSSLDEEIQPTGNAGLDTGNSYLYGIKTFRQAFTPRQKCILLTLAKEIRQAYKVMLAQGIEAERAKAITTCLGLWLSRLTDRFNGLSRWNNVGEKIEGITSMKRFAMTWDFPEVNIFGGASGDAWSNLQYITAVIRQEGNNANPVQCIRGSATEVDFPDKTFDAVITDPPYYNSESYSELSDVCYIWLRPTVGFLYPEHFSTKLTPKKKECVAAAYRQGGKKAANQFYENSLFQSLQQANRVLKSSGILVMVYAHKTTAGWSTLVEAVRRSNFEVAEAWPLDTETKARVAHQGDAALASSIFLVARKREGSKTGYYEDKVQPELQKIVRERVETLWEMGITGADLIIAAVGAGLRAFTRFAKVEYLNGDEVPAERFLSEVEGVVLETLLKKIFENISKQENTEETESEPVANQDYSGVSNVDPQTRFYILWRYTYGRAEIDAGEAIVFAYPQHVELEGRDGIAQGSRALAEKKKTKYRLRDFTERGERSDLGLPDSANNQKNAPTLIDVLHRVLWLVENEPAKIGEYLQEAKPDKEKLRLVAQALAGPGLKGGEADAKLINTTPAETSALGKLLANWRQLVDTYLEDFHLRG